MPLKQFRPWLLALAVIFSLPGAIRAEQPAATQAAPDPSKGKDFIFDSDGVKIHYQVAGKEDGEPVLLIHGFSANIGLQWGAPGIIRGLASDYRVIAIDNRGHGSSGKPHEPDAYGPVMIEDQIRLLDHLKIKKAHIVGYSMGGFITMALLMRHPDRFLSATVGGAGWMQEGDERMNFIEELATSLEEGKGMGPLLIRLTPAGEAPPSEEQIANMSKMVNAMNDPKALAACIRGMRKIVVTKEQITANKVPTLALIGEVDPLKQSVDPLEGVMPNLRIVVIEKANHMTAFGNGKFIESLRGFLAEHRDAAPARAAAGG